MEMKIEDRNKIIDNLFETVKEVLEKLNLNHKFNVGVEYKGEEDSCVCVDDWITVTPFIDKRNCIGREVDIVRYDISLVSVTYGTHFRWDGSGEPDDVDIIHKVEVDTIGQAIKEIVNIYTENAIEDIFGNMFEDSLEEIQETP